jgi:hypothetical protein
VKSIKTRIAAGATILGLGGLTGLALSAGHQKASQPVAAKPLVRTRVIRRTIHVVKHVKPKHPAGAAPVGRVVETSTYGGTTATGSASVTTGSSSVGSAPTSEAAPVTTSTSGASSAPGSSTSAPVVTHASGGGGGEHESERGDD